MQTRQNSTHIEWGGYDDDGMCPDCDFCRECGHAHEVGTYHRCEKQPQREKVRFEDHPGGYTVSVPVNSTSLFVYKARDVFPSKAEAWRKLQQAIMQKKIAIPKGFLIGEGPPGQLMSGWGAALAQFCEKLEEATWNARKTHTQRF